MYSPEMKFLIVIPLLLLSTWTITVAEEFDPARKSQIFTSAFLSSMGRSCANSSMALNLLERAGDYLNMDLYAFREAAFLVVYTAGTCIKGDQLSAYDQFSGRFEIWMVKVARNLRPDISWTKEVLFQEEVTQGFRSVLKPFLSPVTRIKIRDLIP